MVERYELDMVKIDKHRKKLPSWLLANKPHFVTENSKRRRRAPKRKGRIQNCLMTNRLRVSRHFSAKSENNHWTSQRNPPRGKRRITTTKALTASRACDRSEKD